MTRWLRTALLLLTAGLPLGAHADDGVGPGGAAQEAQQALERPQHAQRLELAWASPGATAEERAQRLLAVAQEVGVRGFEPAALVLLHERTPGDPLGRAGLAASVAPELPAAHASFATALLAEGRLVDGAGAWLRSLQTLATHFDSRLWLELAALELLERALAWAGILFLVVLAAFAAPRAAHDLGDLAMGARQHARERTEMPGFARGALLAAVLLLPLALGEGVLGSTLLLFGLAVAYGDGARRRSAACAAALVLFALHPLSGYGERALGSVGSDPVSHAADSAIHSVPAAQDVVRLRTAAVQHKSAAYALALSEKRSGRIAEAESLLAPHLKESSDPALLTLAANLRLMAGDPQASIALYERVVEIAPSALALFNLSQAYGQAIRLPQQDGALARAQALDARTVTRLMAEQADLPRGVVDLPVAAAGLRATSSTPAPTPRVRSPLAPGHLGSPRLGVALFLLVGLLGAAAPRLYRRSRSCARCGARRCPRCDRAGAGEELCEPCARLVHSPEATDAGLRTARLEELRRRQQRRGRLQLGTSLVVPGTAGLLAGRPLQGLGGAVAFALALALLRAPGWLPPDPGSVGAAADLLCASGLGTAALLYLGGLLPGLRARRRG